MKTNANNVLKVLILGVAILIHSGVGVAASGTVGPNGNPTGVTCECIGGQDGTLQVGLTAGVPTGYLIGGLDIGATPHFQGGAGNTLGSVTTGDGNDGGQPQLGSTGLGGQVGYPGGGTNTPNG